MLLYLIPIMVVSDSVLMSFSINTYCQLFTVPTSFINQRTNPYFCSSASTNLLTNSLTKSLSINLNFNDTTCSLLYIAVLAIYFQLKRTGLAFVSQHFDLQHPQQAIQFTFLLFFTTIVSHVYHQRRTFAFFICLFNIYRLNTLQLDVIERFRHDRYRRTNIL